MKNGIPESELMEAEHVKTYGVFYEDFSQDAYESLKINCIPNHLPLEQCWKSNGLSAEFIASYFQNFYANHQISHNVTLSDLHNTIKYVANELLENAMKFQDGSVPSNATVSLSLLTGELIFKIYHGISQQQALVLQRYIERVFKGNPEEVYFEAMQDSIKEENRHYSRLGILSMICDYHTKMGWRFEYYPDKIILISTVVLSFA